jgi:hypothetical protein
VNRAYISYYNAGARVVNFSRTQGIREVGFFITEGGVHFWGRALTASEGARAPRVGVRASGALMGRFRRL